ncbi:MAG: DUF1501 domain-containing protein [Pirellulaceae bacterium]|jgi:hypothetical protein|nr:DUF1501 domain-containing protein [Pirellulaceae bacterium]
MSMPFSRRDWLQNVSGGFGFMALAGLCAEATAAKGPLDAKPTHHPAKAKRVIFLCMRGGPSHVDTFDYKPQLAKDHGKKSEYGNRTFLKSPWKFEQHGDSGLPISDLFPNVAKHADDLCLLNSMYGDVPNHPQAYLQLHTGSFRFVRPSVGAWVLYGLGAETQELPGFVTISPESRVGGAQNYGSAFLPAIYQGTRIGQLGQSVAQAKVGNLSNPQLNRKAQRRQIDFVQDLNRELLERKRVDAQLEGVIESYELAFRMQAAVPEVMDMTSEDEATLKSYGVGAGPTDNFGRQCLMARRFAEAGVRYIELCHGNWDQHGGLQQRLTANCKATDQPIGALLADLKQRGMLDDTLVVWGGEFGRTPHAKKQDGRDHNATGFSMWMAGGGVKGGIRYGSTDEHGVKAVLDRVHFHDLHATMLHLLGLDHKQLTFPYAGRDFRLTDVYGRVLSDVVA